MKLIRINHYRCGEIEETVYMMAPESATEDSIDEDIDKAQTEYDLVQKNFSKDKERPKRINSTSLNEFSETLTIKEAKELVAKNHKELADWQEELNKATLPFTHYMRQRGYKCLWEDEGSGILDKSVHWGHRHGQNVQYDYKKVL